MTADTPPIWLLLDSSKPGGIETYVFELARALAEQGRRATVVFLKNHGPHPLKDRLEQAGLACRSLDGLADLFRTLFKERPALVHTHGYKAGILGRLAARSLGIPHCSTFHSGDPGKGLVRLYTTLDRLSAARDYALAVSEPIAADLGGCAQPPNFVTEAAPLTPGRTIAFVGRFSAEKGADFLPELASALPAQRVLAFGDGPLMEAVRQAAPENLSLRGAVASMETHWDCPTNDIGLLVMPSRAEGLPMAALEAMARGIPVAAFSHGGLPKLLGEGRGWVAAPGNLDGLIRVVQTWSRQSRLEGEARSAACIDYVRHHHSAKAALSVILPVYQRAGLSREAA